MELCARKARVSGRSGPYDGGRRNEFWSVDVILGFVVVGVRHARRLGLFVRKSRASRVEEILLSCDRRQQTKRQGGADHTTVAAQMSSGV